MKAKRTILFFLLVSTAFCIPIVKADGEDWLTGWNYRKRHTITGSIAGAQTDYQIKLGIDYGAGVDSGSVVYLDGHCKTDFGDVNFTKSDGVTPLDYWFDPAQLFDGDNVSIWVEVDVIPAYPSTVNIYLYYGNADESTSSNGNDTFPFFDDFSGTLADKWIETGIGTAVNADGECTLTGTSGQISGIQGKTSFGLNYSARARSKDLDGHYEWYVSWSNFPTVGHYFVIFADVSDNLHSQAQDGGGVDDYISGNGIGEYSEFEVQRFNSTCGLSYIDDVLYYNHGSNVLLSDVPINFQVYGYSSMKIDWALIRKTVDPEPTSTGWGLEESTIMYSPNNLFGAGFNSTIPSIELYWRSNQTDISFFEIQNSTDKISWDYLGNSAINQYTDLQVTNGLERYYRIRACNFTYGQWFNSTFSDINFEKVYFVMDGGDLFPGLAIGISLLIIGAIYELEKRR